MKVDEVVEIILNNSEVLNFFLFIFLVYIKTMSWIIWSNIHNVEWEIFGRSITS